eukprot:g4375.t1
MQLKFILFSFGFLALFIVLKNNSLCGIGVTTQLRNIAPVSRKSTTLGDNRIRLSYRVSERDKAEKREYSHRDVSSVLVTGAAGFIGAQLTKALIQRTNRPKYIVGLDNFNAYYDVKLKRYRAKLIRNLGATVFEGDVCNATLLQRLFEMYNFSHVVHLAAQAGVRYSLTHPKKYVTANVMCTTNLLEIMRKRSRPLPVYIYASSSSVYGHSTLQPFSELHFLDQPSSLYAATKRSCEDLAYVYHHLYGIRATGLRFFTVYGPWGRPDMAVWQWVEAVLNDTPIRLYEKKGATLERDFTYIDDIVNGVISSLYYSAPFEIFNLGKGRPDKINDLINYIKLALDKDIKINRVPIPRADVISTFANVSHAKRLLDYQPKTGLMKGVNNFISWYKEYRNIPDVV